MLNERLVELYEYLNTLSKVQASGHFVNDEIKEVISEIRIELGLDKIKRGTVYDSRRLVFEGKLGGKASFVQLMVFEAVFVHTKEKEIEFQVNNKQAAEADKAISILKDMKAPVEFMGIKCELNGSKFVVIRK